MKSRSKISKYFSIVAASILMIVVFGCDNKLKQGISGRDELQRKWNSFKWEEINSKASENATIPIRPGEPGKSSFWNAYAKRFINVPSFNFKEVPESVKYSFTAISDFNAKKYTFEAEKPWALLTPVWEDLPVGLVYLKVEGLDKTGAVTGTSGEKQFYKAATFNGPYKTSANDYKSSALLNLRTFLKLEHFQRWITDTVPSQKYALYSYPSKIVGAVIESMCLLYNLSDNEEEKETAKKIAENAATYLTNISQPAGTPLEYFPPTYLAVPAKNGYPERLPEIIKGYYSSVVKLASDRKNQTMTFYPAIAGGAYLDLYEVTMDKKYLELAINIGNTYKNIQLDSGSWPMMSFLDSGKSMGENQAIPTDIMKFLDRLIIKYGQEQLKTTYNNAFNWIMNNPMKTFNWEAQFEDGGLSKNYKNLEKGKPLDFAVILLDKSKKHPEYIEMAEELLRYAEDQFIVWEKPLPREMFRTEKSPIPGIFHLTQKWSTPCALEQYGFYTPIDASMDDCIMAFIKAYQVLGNDIYLAKAASLASNLAIAQEMSGGLFPTTMMTFPEGYSGFTGVGDKDIQLWAGWLNCATYSTKALLELNRVVQE